MVVDEPTPNNIPSSLIFAARGAVVMHPFVFQGSGATHIAPVIDLWIIVEQLHFDSLESDQEEFNHEEIELTRLPEPWGVQPYIIRVTVHQARCTSNRF